MEMLKKAVALLILSVCFLTYLQLWRVDSGGSPPYTSAHGIYSDGREPRMAR